ncbi:MAG: PBP1A family penicillin-binding protein [Acidobacteria bacterium]|nr:PBP1A family penicillin-binding protein [Acidobacteriota bacterium]
MRQWTQRLHDLRRSHPGLVRNTAIGALVLVLAGMVVTGWFVASLMRGLPDVDALRRIGEMDQATAVFDRNDQLAFTIFKEQRIEVPLASVSPHLKQAVLAIEDKRFYDHNGFDTVRIGSALLANIRRGRLAQGGSTITQQLARQSFLTPDKTYRRKLQELILAGRIERMYSKDQILEMYLNKVYFGDGLYGVEAASRGYFGKHASELTVPEAALLAGLVKSPSSYAPTVSLERAVARRNVVLQAMQDFGAIDDSARQAARKTKPILKDTLRADEPHGQYFKEQVRRELVDRFGWQRVYQGGLRVYATIDMAMQVAADTAVAEGLKGLDERRAAVAKRRKQAPPSDEAPLQAALVALDPVSGHVLAMIGGRSFDDSHFNRAVQARRQPGSAFKPFVYAAALEAGYTPATLIENLSAPVPTLQGAWTPEDEHSNSDSMTLRAALRTSSNRAAVRLLQDVGIPKTVQYAKAMGVGDVPSVPSLALGSGEVTLQSLTAAYAAFANHGVVPKPLLIRRVEDREGNVLYSSEESGTRAISDVTAYLMSSMLADVVNAGTAAKARTLGFTLPAAGKTGTTNDYHDAWFVGFTPSLVAGVWVGFDQPQTILPNGFAADVAVPLWASFMKAATKGEKPRWLSMPGGIVTADVCRMSGKLAAEGCAHADVIDEHGQLAKRSMVYTEYFARGTQPTTTCEIHASRGFFGTLAAAFTGGGEKPPTPHIEDTGVPAVAATTGETSAPPVPERAKAEEPQKKKRGFWSRVFGISRGDDEEEGGKKPKQR